MKKIIAMLLCVALVAAMGVSAFAGTPDKPDSKTETFTVADWFNYLSNKPAAAKTDLEKYAAALSDAKAKVAEELDAYNKGIKTAAQAVQAAQAATVAAYVNVATQLYQAEATNALNKALAEFQIELDKAFEIPEETNFWATFFAGQEE